MLVGASFLSLFFIKNHNKDIKSCASYFSLNKSIKYSIADLLIMVRKKDKKDKKDKKQKDSLRVKSWYSNRYQIVVVQRNILFLLALISMISVSVAVIFVKDRLGSKSLEPYVIEVEEKSGIATTVDQLTQQRFTANQVIRKYFISQFVTAASGYNHKTYVQDANKVRLLSTPAVYNGFRRRIRRRDLGESTRITTRIKSITFNKKNTAEVRISRVKEFLDRKPEERDELITMTYFFTNVELTMEERLTNPLGFQVRKYLVTEEAFDY